MRHLILTATLCLLAVAGAFSQNKVFTGLVNNNWDEPNNWSPQGVPTATDDDSIPPSKFVIMPFSPISVAGLRLGTGVTLTGGTSSSINITQFGRSQGAFVGVPLTVASGAVFHLHSLSSWDNSFYEGLTNNGTFNYYEGVLNLGPGEIINSGQFFGKDQPGQTVEKNIYSYGLGITNNAGAIFRHENANGSGGLPFKIWVPFLNNGALQVRENTEGITFYSDFTNNANIQFASSGIFNFYGLNTLSTCTFNPGGGITAPVGPLSWNGAFRLTGDVNINYAITVNNNTGWNFESGTVGGTGSFNFVNTDGVQFVQNSVLQIPVTNGAGQTVVFGTASPTDNTLSALLTNNGTLNVYGNLTMDGGTIINNESMFFDFNDPKTISNGGGVNLITNNKAMYVDVPTFFQIKVENKTAASRFYPGNSVAVDFATLFDNEGEIVPNNSPTSSIGTASLKEAFKFTSTSVTNIEFDGAAHDFIQILGLNNDLTLNGGTLNINVIGTTPPPGNYVIIDVPNNLRPASGNRQLLGINGSFTTINLPPGAALNNNGTQIFITFAFPPPDITCPPDATVSTDVSVCFSSYTFPPPTGTTDPSCEPITYTADPPAPYSLGTTTVTFTGTDACGGTASCQTTITVEDNDPPDIICPNDFTVSTTSGTCTACPPLPPPSIFDYCDSQPSYITDAPNCSTQFFQLGTTTVTYTAFDDSGNTATCSLDVTVEDNEPPVINCPSPVTVSAGANCQGIMPDLTLSASASDNCGVASIAQAPPPGVVIPYGTTTAVLTVTDPSGNTATCSTVVTVEDDVPPTIICPPDATANSDVDECSAFVSVPPATISDNCGIEAINNDYNFTSDASDTYPVGLTTVVWTVLDVVGLTSSCSMTVEVFDNQAPDITCPGDIFANAATGSCQATVSVPPATATDNCAPPPTISRSPSGNIFPVGTTTVTFTATDASGNTAVCQINVNVQDTQAPVIVGCPPNTTVNTDPDQCSAGYFFTPPTVTDNCPGASIVQSSGQPSGTPLPLGTTVNTFTATDASGNQSFCSFFVTVRDGQSPNLVCPPDATISTDAGVCSANFTPPPATATDNCTPTSQINIFYTPSITNFPLGTTSLVYTAVDLANNSSQCSMQLTVVDDEPPAITCPQDMVESNDLNTCQATLTIPPATATDNCTSSPTISRSPSGNIFLVGTTTVTFTATDASGNAATCQMTVTVLDTQAPVIVGCPQDIFADTDPGSCEAVVSFTPPSVVDNCPGATIVQTGGLPSGSAFPLGTTTNTFVATDSSGNAVNCTFTVVVTDNDAPSIVCPPNVTLGTDAGVCTANFTPLPATATDNCTPSGSITVITPPGGNFPLGNTTLVYNAIDLAGNSSQCTMLLTVVDDEPPVITCPANINANAATGTCQATVSIPNATATDNCTASPTITRVPAGNVFQLGTTTVTFTATDTAGNTDQCDITVTVNDVQAPAITCPPNVNTTTDPGVCSATFTLANATATDNCPGSVSITNNAPPGNTFQLGTTTVTFTATDAQGNTAACTMIVTVVDDESPVLLCPNDVTIQTAPGTCQSAPFAIPNGTATDNCTANPTITNNAPTGGIYPLGNTNVTFTATDAAGNIDQCVAVVTVEDNEAPVITFCPVGDLVETDPGLCTAEFDFDPLTATDNCTPSGSLAISSNPPFGFDFPVGTTTVTFTVTDASGNTAQCTAEVEVEDTEEPIIICPVTYIEGTAGVNCDTTVTIPAPTVIDNCGATVTNDAPPGNLFSYYDNPTLVTFTATDAAGNQAFCEVEVVINDLTAPVLTCPDNVTISTSSSNCNTTLNLPPVIAVDNCVGPITAVQSPPNGTQLPFGTSSITYTATDNDGNESICTISVTVTDSIAPAITCPSNVTVGSNPTGCEGTATLTATATDNCTPPPTIVQNPPGNIFQLGTTTVTFTATDGAGNTATCTTTVTVQDNLPPSITCPDNITANTDAGTCTFTAPNFAATATDNCTAPTAINIAQNPPGNVFQLGTTTVTFTATDANNNTAVCTASVTVNDTQLPTLTCPANTTVSTNTNACEGTANLTASATDNCTPTGGINITQNPPDNIFPLGTTTLAFTATDAANNIATCTTTVTVEDTQPPTLDCPDDLTVGTDTDVCTGTANLTATATDNCPATPPTIAQSPSGNTFPLGPTTVTFTATDASGNQFSCTTLVTVEDAQQPSITCPADLTVNTDAGVCTGTANLTATAADNCPATPPTISQSPTGNTFPLGPTTVTFTATDASGNPIACSMQVTVQDAQQPSITCPADLTVGTDAGVCTGTANLTATATDNCTASGNLTISQSPTGNTFPLGPTTVTFTTTDASGNQFSCATLVTVEDTQSPTLVCPDDLTVGTDADVCTGTANLTATATDNCTASGNLTISQSPTGNTFPLGPTTVTFTATDAGGNTLACTMSVTVQDVQPPVFQNCPATTLDLQTDPGQCMATADFTNITASATDNCTSPVPVQGPASNVFPVGAGQTATFTATDDAGQTSVCTITINVADAEPPMLTCPPNLTLATAPGTCAATPDFSQIMPTDNCGVQNLTTNPPGSIAAGSPMQVTFTATDAGGNSTVCITEVEVFDTEAPQFDNCPGALTIPTDAGLCSATFSFTNITASDNCDGALPVQGPTTGTFQLGPNPPVLLSATDAAGTAASCAVTVTVEDQEPPNITCPPNVVTDPDPGECTATVNLDPASATDNCTANLTIETMPSAPGNTFPVGTTVITYMATDDMGNEDICQTSITVNGTDVLSITCPLPQNLDAGAACSVTVPFQNATFVALCGLQSLDNNWPPNDEFPVGQTLVTFTVTDVAGGTESCQTIITVSENVPPTFAGCPNDLTVLANLPGCQATAAWGTPLATDNCTPASQVSTAQPGDTFPLGTTTVTYTAADLNGNTAICQFSVTVNPASTVSTLDTAVCAGRPVTVGSSTFTAPGTYTVNLTNALGCDSTVTLNLANVTQLFGTATATICAGQSILLGGALQTEAGFYMDTLLALGGCDSIVTTELFVNPTPTFSIMGPISICPGVFAVLSAGLFSQHQWSPGGATTPQISVDQPGIYAATVTDANGCTASDVFDLTNIYCGPVTAAFAVARDTACANLFVGFTDQSLGNVQEWFWDFGNGNFSTLQNPSTYFPNPGDYTVRLIVRDGLDADTATRRIHIYPQIKGNFTTNVPDLCHPLELDFAGTATAKFGVDAWRWNFGDGDTGTGQNTSHDYPNYGTANATLVIQDKFGCVDSLSRDVDISPNSVAPQPVFIQKILCPGESFTVGATVFDETNLTGAVVLTSAAGCDSVVNVAVSYIPGGNISLGADTVICENQSLTLDAGPATNYLWSTGASTQTITVTQAGTYSVVISNNGNCAASGQITVGVDAIPGLQADAGADAAICSSQQFFKMNAAAPSVGTGRWSTAGTAILDNPASPQSFVSQLANGNNIFTWTLDNGACKAYSSDNVTVSVTPEVNETANAGPDLAFCASGATVQLAALAPASPGVVGTWAQTSGAPLNIADPNGPQTTVTGLNATDIYTLEWTLSNGACGDFSSNEVNISLSSKVLAAANAGDNASLCQQSTLQLNANQPPPGGTAIWTIDGTSPTLNIADVTSPNTVVSAIPPGTTRLIWTFSTPLCPNYSADTLIVFQSSGLEANDDAYLFLGQPLTNLDFVANDAVGDPDNVTLTLTGTPSLGKVNRNQDGTHDFSFMGDAPGATSFGYEICLKACPNICDEAFVTIGVKSDSVPVLIPPRNVFTPNGDGVGDRMVIENFDDITTDIVLIVLNRWGNVVYENKQYNNDWDGRDNDGNPLPEGSYIYVLRGGGIGPDGDNEETGVITIMR